MPHALVIGGSLGGLFAANLLRSIGWTAQVFERVGDDLASRGAGIGSDNLASTEKRIVTRRGDRLHSALMPAVLAIFPILAISDLI